MQGIRMNTFKIRAGAASCPIEFSDRLFPTDGFSGIHDDPYMGIVLIEAGTKAALVSGELVNIPDDVVFNVRKMISEQTGTPFENIWVHATHTITTPHAPGGMDLLPEQFKKNAPAPPQRKPGEGPKKDPDAPAKRECFTQAVYAAAQKCIGDAMDSMREAQIGAGVAMCDVNVNRDIETPFGWWISLGGGEFSDKKLTMICIKDEADAPIAYLMSYGVKPCAIDNSQKDENGRLVCGDITGYACRMVEEKLGAPCMFFMPAAADQVPREQAMYQRIDDAGNVITEDLGIEKGLEIVERLGKELGEAAVAAAGAAEGFTGEGELCHKADTVNVPARGRAMMPRTPATSQEFAYERDQALEAETITLGDIAFVAVKPEVCARTGAELQEMSPFKHTIMMSMVNGGMKYMPDKWSYDHVTWESQNTVLLPGGAEKWRDLAVSMLK